MVSTPEGPPSVALPERLDRRLRLGPFPSARDALKFVLYAAMGAFFALFTSPYIWLPIVGVGFLLSVWRPEGDALDERALAIVLWYLRRRWKRGSVNEPVTAPMLRRGLLKLSEGTIYAVIRAGGAPLAYLPPIELQRRFESYRDLLRALDGSFFWSARTAPIRPDPVLPKALPDGETDLAGRAGYRELVDLLCRRRSLRRVDVVLRAAETGPDGIAALERRAGLILDRLSALGIRASRLRERALLDAGRRLDWNVGSGRP